MAICLLPEKVNEFKQALKNKEIKIADLINMTTEARTALLEKYAGSNAKEVNTLFEEKLVLKNRIQGIKNWAAKIGEVGKYSDKGKIELETSISEYRAAQQKRIFSPKENEAFLNDLADKKIGVHISRDVAKNIFEMTAKMAKLKAVDPTIAGVSDAYLKQKQDLNNYIASQTPLTTAESLGRNLVVIARNNLLLNPATPIKTTTGQIVNSVMEGATRRLANLTTGGSNLELVRRASAEAWETFKKTGVNVAGMEGPDDLHIMNKGENFRVPSGTDSSGKALRGLESVVRGAAKISNKVAIDLEHVGPFTKFYQKAFYDMSSIVSDDIAKQEGLTGAAAKARSAEIFKDAAMIEPKTAEGAMVRLRAQQSAARVTSTNDTFAARISMGAKKWLNDIIPGFPLGDLVVPIAKIPSTIVANGIDNAGGGLPFAIRDIFKGRALIQSPDLEVRYKGMTQFANGVQRLMRIGTTLGVAALLASHFSKEDFRDDVYGNHFVKIGNIWINMEYIAAISPALAGFMWAKGKATSAGSALVEYGVGAGQGLKNIPGVDEGTKLINAILNENIAKGIIKYTTDFFSSRGVPTFMQNLLKNRPIDRLFFGATGVETVQNVKEDKDAAAKKAAASRAKK